MRIFTLLKNMIKVAKLLSVDDSERRFGTVFMSGKNQKMLLFTPYGFMHNPPRGSAVVCFNQQAQEANIIGIADDQDNRTLKDLAEGEVAVGNYLTDNYIKFDEKGLCTLVCEDLNVQVTNDITVTATNLNVIISEDTSLTTGTLTMEADTTAEITAGTTLDLNSGTNLSIDATANLSLSGAIISASGTGASIDMDVSGNVDITSTSLSHNSTNIGDDHYHTQGNDSDGDTEQDTSGPN